MFDTQDLQAHALAEPSCAPTATLQRACRTAAQCAVPSLGDAGQFGAEVEAESEAIAQASGGVSPAPGAPTSCTLPRHGESLHQT
jgi:hypothetical protein